MPRDKDAGWPAKHKAINERVKKGNVDLLMIGDSITHGWEGGGKEVWKKFYEKRNAVNLGIGGDQTQHVLWRLENGNIDGIKPKLAVVMIGTNNVGLQQSQGNRRRRPGHRGDAPHEAAARRRSCCWRSSPAGPTPRRPRARCSRKTNEIIAKLADDKNVFFLDIGPKFLDKDGNLPKDIMPDFLHPNAKGYAIWAEAMEPSVKKLMGE